MTKPAEPVVALSRTPAWQAQLKSDGSDPAQFADEILNEVRQRLTNRRGLICRWSRRSLPRLMGQDLLETLTGLDPLYLVPALTELSSCPTRSTARSATRALARLRDLPAVDKNEPGAVDGGHPLDFDWRFDEPTRDLVRSFISSSAAGRLLLLGCPTIAADRSFASMRVTLIDDNPALHMAPDSQTVDFRRVDLLAHPDITANIDADYAVADPPFYEASIAAFLRAAATGLRIGGQALVALPTKWARASAARDVAAAVAIASDLGLKVIGTHANAARYLTPKFERATYARIGLPGVPDRWRTADFVQFELVRRAEPAMIASVSDRHLWHEAQIGNTRWRVRLDEASPAAAHRERRLFNASILSGEVQLTTVSRRDRDRATANVMTDDNRVYHSTDPAVLLFVLRAIASRGDPQQAAMDAVGRALSTTERGVVAELAARLTGI